MSDEIREWRNALGRMPQRAREICDGLDDAQLNWSPGDHRWSIAQCLDHLNRANGKIIARLEEGIRKVGGAGAGQGKPWKPGWLERLFIRMVGANAPIKSPVPPDFVPADSASAAEVLPEFEERHRRFITCLDHVERLGLVRVKVASPVSKLIKCSLGAWFAATIEHDLYHLGQADRVRAAIEQQVIAAE